MNDTTQARSILPDHAQHPHNPLYRHLLAQVAEVAPERTAQQRANLAAGLLDAYLRTLPEGERGRRLDETTIRGLDVVAGRSDATTPSLFVAGPNQGEGAPRISTPLATAQVAASTTLAAHAQQRSIDADGYLTDPGITRTAIPSLERGALGAVNGIVLHRTDGSTAEGTFSHWRGQTNPYGTHFVIDKDGTIHQTASLNNQTSHVGAIRSRGEVDGTISTDEQRRLDAARRAPGSDTEAVAAIERTRAYPDRFPASRDSIGIEVVGDFNERTQRWDAPTPEQTASIRRLVGTLQNNYGLNDNDIYQHDRISYKQAGEGAGLYQPDAHSLRAPGPQPGDAGVQQPSGPTR